MKQSSVRGTPVTFRGPNGDPGYGGMTPGSYGSGTPVNSTHGNADNSMRQVSSGMYGMVDTPAAGNQADHNNNGNGVLFNGVSEGRDYLASPAAAMDSPVPDGKQMPNTNLADSLNALRNGSGKDYSGSKQIPDQIVSAGGVLSRGMLGTSTPNGAAGEMIEDDVLVNSGRGGALG